MKSQTTLRLGFLVFFLAVGLTAASQSQIDNVKSFEKLVVSPHIELILIKGEKQQVRWEFKNISANKLNSEIEGRTLHLYLDQAKVTPKLQKNRNEGWNYKESIYKHARVRAYVTYQTLKSLEVRGNEKISSKDPLVEESFRLKLYGDSDAYFSSIETSSFKASLYGENTLDIGGGAAFEQHYRCYGENVVRASNFEGKEVSTTIFGESELSLNASGTIKVTSLGEGKVHYQGAAELNKGLILGETSISRSKTPLRN